MRLRTKKLSKNADFSSFLAENIDFLSVFPPAYRTRNLHLARLRRLSFFHRVRYDTWTETEHVNRVEMTCSMRVVTDWNRMKITVDVKVRSIDKIEFLLVFWLQKLKLLSKSV